MSNHEWRPCNLFQGEVYRIVYNPDGDYVIRKNLLNGQQRRVSLPRFIWAEYHKQHVPKNVKIVEIDPSLPCTIDNLRAIKVQSGRKPTTMSKAELRYKKWTAEYTPRTGLVEQLRNT